MNKTYSREEISELLATLAENEAIATDYIVALRCSIDILDANVKIEKATITLNALKAKYQTPDNSEKEKHKFFTLEEKLNRLDYLKSCPGIDNDDISVINDIKMDLICFAEELRSSRK